MCVPPCISIWAVVFHAFGLGRIKSWKKFARKSIKRAGVWGARNLPKSMIISQLSLVIRHHSWCHDNCRNAFIWLACWVPPSIPIFVLSYFKSHISHRFAYIAFVNLFMIIFNPSARTQRRPMNFCWTSSKPRVYNPRLTQRASREEQKKRQWKFV